MLKIPFSRFCSSIRSTTIFAIRKNLKTIIMGDGQVTQGSLQIKDNAHKIKQIRQGVYCGFAGSLADCITLMEQLEVFVDKYPRHQLLKPCIELAKKWRTEPSYKRLEASLLVVDKREIIEIDGCGNVMVHDKFRGIGSGGPYAECAAEALYDLEDFDSEMIAQKAMHIASSKCIYTNNNFVIERIYDVEEESNNSANEAN